MLYSITTGIIAGLLFLFDFLYVFIRKYKLKRIKVLNLHMFCGIILIVISVIHIAPGIGEIAISSGFVLFSLIVLTVLSGVLLKVKIKSKLLRMLHHILAVLSVIAFICHITLKIVYLMTV